MDSLGETIRKLREEKELPLRTVAAYLDIDQAILSKIERGLRNATREQVVKLAAYFKVKESDLLVSWLSDKLVYELSGEQLALEALKLAEEKVAYKAFLKVDRSELILCLKNEIKQFSKVQKAWIYGSFSRNEDGPQSDLDIAIQADESLSYFDLAEIQYQLEKALNRKIDLGFIDSFKPYIFENLKPDLKLVYERQTP
jgi:predicted nucleotidyltransferase/plasmid maintenance system antidote protein VapI